MYVRSFHVFNPLESLTLRVNHQRPTTSSRDNDAVFCRERVTGQALNVPVTDFCWVDQETTKIQISGAWNFKFYNLVEEKKLFYQNMSSGKVFLIQKLVCELK